MFPSSYLLHSSGYYICKAYWFLVEYFGTVPTHAPFHSELMRGLSNGFDGTRQNYYPPPWNQSYGNDGHYSNASSVFSFDGDQVISIAKSIAIWLPWGKGICCCCWSYQFRLCLFSSNQVVDPAFDIQCTTWSTWSIYMLLECDQMRSCLVCIMVKSYRSGQVLLVRGRMLCILYLM